MSGKKRSEFIDVAKGIAMICIVLGHMSNPAVERVVFTFHVPIFFLISGYFISARRSKTEFVINKVKTLIVPYILASCAIIAVSFPVNEIFWGGDNSKGVMLYWLKAAFWGSGIARTMPIEITQIGAIWFLLASFWASIVLRFLLDAHKEIRVVAVVGIFAICWWSVKVVWLPFSIQASGTALLFMYVGYLIRLSKDKIESLNLEVKIFFIIFAVAMWINFIMNYQGFGVVECYLGRGLLDIICAICGSYCVILISKGIERYLPKVSKTFAYLGKYSLIMLCAHIVELDVFPWVLLTDRLNARGLTENVVFLCMVVAKAIWILPITIICSKLKFTRRLFGYRIDH